LHYVYYYVEIKSFGFLNCYFLNIFLKIIIPFRRLSTQDDDDYENYDDDDVVVRRGDSFQRRKDTSVGNKQHQHHYNNNSNNQTDSEAHEDTDIVFPSTRQAEGGLGGGTNRKEYMEVRDDEDLSVSDEYDDIAIERSQQQQQYQQQQQQQQQQRYHDIDDDEEEDGNDNPGATGNTRRVDAHPLLFEDHLKLLERVCTVLYCTVLYCIVLYACMQIIK